MDDSRVKELEKENDKLRVDNWNAYWDGYCDGTDNYYDYDIESSSDGGSSDEGSSDKGSNG